MKLDDVSRMCVAFHFFKPTTQNSLVIRISPKTGFVQKRYRMFIIVPLHLGVPGQYTNHINIRSPNYCFSWIVD